MLSAFGKQFLILKSNERYSFLIFLLYFFPTGIHFCLYRGEFDPKFQCLLQVFVFHMLFWNTFEDLLRLSLWVCIVFGPKVTRWYKDFFDTTLNRRARKVRSPKEKQHSPKFPFVFRISKSSIREEMRPVIIPLPPVERENIFVDLDVI